MVQCTEHTRPKGDTTSYAARQGEDCQAGMESNCRLHTITLNRTRTHTHHLMLHRGPPQLRTSKSTQSQTTPRERTCDLQHRKLSIFNIFDLQVTIHQLSYSTFRATASLNALGGTALIISFPFQTTVMKYASVATKLPSPSPPPPTGTEEECSRRVHPYICSIQLYPFHCNCSQFQTNRKTPPYLPKMKIAFLKVEFIYPLPLPSPSPPTASSCLHLLPLVLSLTSLTLTVGQQFNFKLDKCMKDTVYKLQHFTSCTKKLRRVLSLVENTQQFLHMDT